MTPSRLFLFLILKGILADNNDTKSSNGVQLWRAQGELTEEVLEEFYERARFTEDIWQRNNSTIDFLIYENEIPYVTGFLDENNMTHMVLMREVDGVINDEIVKKIPTRRTADGTISWTEYPTLAEINRYLTKMSSTYRTLCKMTSIGKTAHGTPINMMKISNGNAHNGAILVDAGTHGREWTAVISTLYFIDNVLKNYNKLPEYIKKRDWYIIPVLNPDGYEYSMTKDRIWRKNTRRLSGQCIGVDLNSNYDYNWCQQESFQITCSNYYCGPFAFSEEETQAIKKLVDGKHFNGYISIHSSGTRVIYPWADGAILHDDLNSHRYFTNEMALAMRKVARVRYTNGVAEKKGIGKSSGMAIDWMFFVKEVKHSYMIETRGVSGFDLLHSRDIEPAVKEVYAGLSRFAQIL